MVILDLKSVDPVDVALKNKLQDFFDNYLKLELNEVSVKLFLLECLETHYNSYVESHCLDVDYEGLEYLKGFIEELSIKYGVDFCELKEAENC